MRQSSVGFQPKRGPYLCSDMGKPVFSKECIVPPFPNKQTFESKLSHQEFANTYSTSQGLVCPITNQFGIPNHPKCQFQSGQICYTGKPALTSLPRRAKQNPRRQLFSRSVQSTKCREHYQDLKFFREKLHEIYFASSV